MIAAMDRALAVPLLLDFIRPTISKIWPRKARTSPKTLTIGRNGRARPIGRGRTSYSQAV